MRTKLLGCFVAVLWGLNGVLARAQPVQFVAIPYESFIFAFTNKAALQLNYPMLGLDREAGLVLWTFNPAPTNWVVESSVDGAKWRTDRVFFSAYATQNPMRLQAGGTPGTNGSRIYRARMAPDLRTPALKDWSEKGVKNYTFDYDISCFCRTMIRGTVTVRDGKVFSVTNAVHKVIFGPPDPVPPDASQFPSIDQLLGSLSGTGLFLSAILDPVYGYPATIISGSPETDAGSITTVRNFIPTP